MFACFAGISIGHACQYNKGDISPNDEDSGENLDVDTINDCSDDTPVYAVNSEPDNLERPGQDNLDVNEGDKDSKEDWSGDEDTNSENEDEGESEDETDFEF